MITPRRTRLVAVEGARGLRAWLASAVLEASPDALRETALVVPSRTAAELLRRTIERRCPPHRAFVLPDLLTRGEWYAAMHARTGPSAPVLSSIEREVMADAAAREAASGGEGPPFRLRPGLIAEVLALYDVLGRHRRSLDDFERVVLDVLGHDEGIDRGAARLARQTRWFAAMLRGYERRREASGALDERALRAHLLASDRAAYRHVILTVGDRQSSPPGLFDADFDLLTRLAGLERIDVVATAASLDAGLRQRLRVLLPGIEEVAGPGPDEAGGWTAPYLDAPPAGESLVFLARDREQEVSEAVRDIKRAGEAPGGAGPLDRIAVVFRRPLPYVYLARALFEKGGVPYQATDALPLAAEPVAAALDLALTAVTAGFSRDAIVSLVASPLWQAGDGRQPPGAAAALDRALEAAGFLGGADQFDRLAGGLPAEALAAGEACRALVGALAPLGEMAPASSHLARLDAFIRRFESLPLPADPTFERHARARAAILSAVAALREAHARFDDPVIPFGDLAATLRRWIERQTFAPREGASGVQLIDAEAAPFADLDRTYLLGLVAGEWEESEPPNIFYPGSILCQLGWPTESARLASARSAFLDLVRSPAVSTRVSLFSLEADAIVEPSPLIEDLDGAGLDVRRQAAEASRVLVDEGLATDPLRADLLAGRARAWADLRLSRGGADEPRYHGRTAPAASPSYKVTSVDRYVECPFRYFAIEVLGLEEEREEPEGLSPLDEGRLVHEVLRAFLAEWDRRGEGAITPGSIDRARRLFAEVAGERLSALSGPDAELERMRLFGSPLAAGFGEIVCAAEAEDPPDLVGRLLEVSLDGEYELASAGGTRVVRVRGKADRIDLLQNRRFRLVDYKVGTASSARQSVQVPVYAACAAQWLARRFGGTWTVDQASYLALSARPPVKRIHPPGRGANLLDQGQRRFVEAVQGIERGEFPPRPLQSNTCSWCRFAAVCRKDIVSDDEPDETE